MFCRGGVVSILLVIINSRRCHASFNTRFLYDHVDARRLAAWRSSPALSHTLAWRPTDPASSCFPCVCGVCVPTLFGILSVNLASVYSFFSLTRNFKEKKSQPTAQPVNRPVNHRPLPGPTHRLCSLVKTVVETAGAPKSAPAKSSLVHRPPERETRRSSKLPMMQRLPWPA